MKNDELINIKKRCEQLIKDVDSLIKKSSKKYEIGGLFKRVPNTKIDKNCVYALVSWNGEIRFMNITNNHFWKTDMKTSKVENYVSGSKKGYLTESEMNDLIGYFYKDFEPLKINFKNQ